MYVWYEIVIDYIMWLLICSGELLMVYVLVLLVVIIWLMFLCLRMSGMGVVWCFCMVWMLDL